MNFSAEDYDRNFLNGLYQNPINFRPYLNVDKQQFKKLEEYDKRKGIDYKIALTHLKERLGRDLFLKVSPPQVRTIDYSNLTFPAYKFILPEMLADDWLSIVGWHKYGRDHIRHQPLVAYIVLKLLTGGGDSRQALRINNIDLVDRCVDEILKFDKTYYLKEHLSSVGVSEDSEWFEDTNKSRILWKSLFIETAYLAAVFHDMGYPWQYINMLDNSLAHVGYLKDSPNTDANKIYEKFGERLFYYPFNGYKKPDPHTPSIWKEKIIANTSIALRKSHGFPGAIGFLYLNDVIRKYPDDSIHPIQRFCVEWAAMAIMMHDMGKLYWGDDEKMKPLNPQMQLKFDVDPLSCIVTLADVLEDFERYSATFTDNESSSDQVHINYEIDGSSTDLSINRSSGSSRMSITYEVADRSKLAIKKSFLPGDEEMYFDKQNGFLNLSALGIEEITLNATSI